VSTLLTMGCCKEHVYHLSLRPLVNLTFGYVQVPILIPLQFTGIDTLANEPEIGHGPAAAVIPECNANANEDSKGDAVTKPTVLAHIHLAKTSHK
jgi:hypothetical protein